MSVELEGRMNEMCNVSDYWEEVALQTGREEGRKEGRIEAAKNLLRMKLGTYEQIAQVQSLSVEEVKQLALEIE